MEVDKDGWPSWWTLNFSREQPFEAAQDALATFWNGMFDPINKDDRWYAERFFKSFFYDYHENKKGGLQSTVRTFLDSDYLSEKRFRRYVFTYDLGNPGARDGRDRKVNL